MPAPEISVLIPVYNAAPYLTAAINSILSQSVRNFELIAVDDGSTDGSGQILQAFAGKDARVRVISRPNTGIVGALNDGLAAVRGEFIARMDGDDEAAPDRFARQLERFRAEPNLVCLGSAVVFMNAAGQSVESCPRALTHEELDRALLACDGGALIHPAVMLRSAAVRAVGGYRLFRADAQYFEDLDLFLRLARVGTLANLAEPLLRYRVHFKSINFTKNAAGRQAVKLAVMQDAYEARGLPFDPEKFPADPGHYSDPADYHQRWAATSLNYGSRRVALTHGYHAVRLRPLEIASWQALRYALTGPMPKLPTPDRPTNRLPAAAAPRK